MRPNPITGALPRSSALAAVAPIRHTAPPSFPRKRESNACPCNPDLGMDTCLPARDEAESPLAGLASALAVT